MFIIPFAAWLIAGAALIIAEFLLPGLVAIFIGMGALTVALGMHLGYVTDLLSQLMLFMGSSLFYLFTLRFLILKFLPSDTVKSEINEDVSIVGEIVSVVEEISNIKTGRVEHSDSTWPARSQVVGVIAKGEKVKIIGRDNITWIVEKI